MGKLVKKFSLKKSLPRVDTNCIIYHTSDIQQNNLTDTEYSAENPSGYRTPRKISGRIPDIRKAGYPVHP